jgi:hypothetical protein
VIQAPYHLPSAYSLAARRSGPSLATAQQKGGLSLAVPRRHVLASSLPIIGWDAARIARTAFVALGAEACANPGVEVIVKATGIPPGGQSTPPRMSPLAECTSVIRFVLEPGSGMREVRFAPDSSLEGAVNCELVSEMKLPPRQKISF